MCLRELMRIRRVVHFRMDHHHAISISTMSFDECHSSKLGIGNLGEAGMDVLVFYFVC